MYQPFVPHVLHGSILAQKKRDNLSVIPLKTVTFLSQHLMNFPLNVLESAVYRGL